MKKIWLISYNLDGVTAGPSVRFQRYAPFFMEKGYRLVFLTYWLDRGLPQKESREHFDIIRVRSDSRVFKHTLFITRCLLKALFSAEKPKAVLTFSIATFNLWLWPFMKLRRLKWIYINTMSLHTTYLQGNSWLHRMYNGIHRKLYGILFSNLNAVVNSSNALTEGFKKLHVPDAVLKVIYNGVNSKRFKPVSESEKGMYRKTLNLPEKGKIILFVGLKVDRKGITDLIESWKLLYPKHPDYYLVLVGDEKSSAGDPDYNQHWEQLKKTFENPDLRILNRPNHPQIEQYFFSSDVFAFLSKKEGMPNVVLESMAAGIPMVLTAFEGFSDDYGMDGSHYLLTERRPEQIAETLEKLLSDADLYRKIRQNALDRVEAHFLVESSIDKYIRLFEA